MTSSAGWLVLASVLTLVSCKGGESEDALATQGSAPTLDAGPEHAPEHAPEIRAAISRGHDLFFGRAMCSTCHRVGDEGAMIVGPNLGVGDEMSEPLAIRAQTRGENIDPPVYVIDSILDPDGVVTPSYARGVMKSPDDIPVELSEDELADLVAFLLSTGATEPLDPAALERARAQIPKARAARELRRAAK